MEAEQPECELDRDDKNSWDEVKEDLEGLVPQPTEPQHGVTTFGTTDNFEIEHVHDFGRAIYFSRQMADNSSPTSTYSRLANDLRNAMEPGAEFLPLDKLVSLVNADRVYQELRSSSMSEIAHDELSNLATAICRWVMVELRGAHGNQTVHTSRRAIFAILVLMDRSSSIGGFVKSKVWDCHLPFKSIKRQQREGEINERRPEEQAYYAMCDNSETLIPDDCFSGWKDCDWETFKHKQWQTLAPYFAFPTEENRRPLHYELNCSSLILPFTGDATTTQPQVPGGFADVFKVRIHPAHHDHHVPVSSYLSFPLTKSPNFLLTAAGRQ